MERMFVENGSESVESIKYPISVFGEVKKASLLSLDIGGSLAKLVYLVEDSDENIASIDETSTTIKPLKTLKMRFVKFHTKYIEECLDFIQKYLITSNFSIKTQTISATGGGAIKYGELITNKLGLKIIKEDEMDCTIKGCVFLLKHVKDEYFCYNKDVFPYFTYQDQKSSDCFPFLLVNIGSGVSIIKVESVDKYERVGGTSLGGGTFWGLGSLLTSARDFDELLKLAEEGKNSNVDMLVKDIYGGNYTLLGLPGDLLASSFGKMVRCKNDNKYTTNNNYSESDIAKSLLYTICNTVGQLACLYAQIHNLNKIFFGGFFTRNNVITLHFISMAVKYYSGGVRSAYFFRHEGFIGALGAYTKGIARDHEQKNMNSVVSNTISKDPEDGFFIENIAASSYKEYDVIKQSHPLNVVSLDFTSHKVASFPLLKSSYETTIDVSFFKEYIKYIKDGIDVFIEELKNYYLFDQKKFSQLSKNFIIMFKKRLEYFKEEGPDCLNSVQTLLDMRDNFIKEYLLIDPFLKLKHTQNFDAINNFKDYIQSLDSIEDISTRLHLIFQNLFAGNFVDMSSTEYLKYKHDNPDSPHSQNLKFIQSTKTHYIDGSLPDWVHKFQSGKWKKIVMFVDNSGYDIIFGVYALIREFIKIGATVVLISNTYPSFNDVVSSELTLLANRLKNICPLLEEANDVSLLYGQTGFGSSCLDLRAIDRPTCELSTDADLVIVEGQSRCLVSNYNTQFKCDSLKLGAITSEVLASKYNFKLFDTFMKFNFI